MSSDAPPIVLTFGLSDPTGASGLQADLLTLASIGCHGASVLTGYAVRDSAASGDVTGLDPEAVASQARMLLEDMPIAAFKVGATTRAEIVSAIAEVVADYDDLPLILVPDFTLDEQHVLAGDELRESIAELLAPQTTVLIADPTTLVQLAQPDSDADPITLDGAITHLLGQGCEYVLCTDARPSQLLNTLFSEEGQVRQDAWERGGERLIGLADTLGAALTALLANGQDPGEAVREAQEYVHQAIRHAYRPGMGGYMLDRFFWARTTDKGQSPPAAEPNTPTGALRH
ncbi:hydroxymethylpyrimidine/phosphomethylpyrimidine kinase [Mycetohabitans sp. B8]|uniref:bifunctional hydroxymethylpyrimidine kinase/phosphomethylpyrimidine kinase n=1 Tax=Mycetohabitans sp. B8 TaxID=2841845 RepID=UPI001F404692|nr:hydroxymethylpyrimidine/phosphomethylpyrimidine kinase [Mycetohabitans sp. B8]MCG1043173.1 hydroxymethylpyrimidine/phosphomethylpyrimidine kinase [Mycetohabitans sp. B8]